MLTPAFAAGEITADTVLTYTENVSTLDPTVTWHLDIDENQIVELEESTFEMQFKNGSSRWDSLQIDNDSDRDVYVDILNNCNGVISYQISDTDPPIVAANSSDQFWMHGTGSSTDTCGVTFRVDSHGISETKVVEPFWISDCEVPFAVVFKADIPDDGLAGGSINIGYSNGLTLDSVTFNNDFGLTLLSESDTAYFVDTDEVVTPQDNYTLFTAYFTSSGGSDVVRIDSIFLDDDDGDPITPVVDDVGWISC